MHIDFDRDRIMGELSRLESRLADLSDTDTDTIQEIFDMICRQEDFVVAANNEQEKLTTGDLNAMNEVNQKVMDLCKWEIFSQLEESDRVRALIQNMQTKIQEALALPLEVRTLIAQMADSPQLRQVAKVWKDAAETAVTEADLKRLEVFKSQYTLPIREEEENAYSYLRRSLLTIIKAQDQYFEEELNLSGISPLTLLEILEEKIEDECLLKFCSIIFDDFISSSDDIQKNPEYWREKISEKAPEIESLSLNNKGLRRLPKEISEFKNIKAIYLSGNQLTSLPEGISELKNLTELNLSNNRLTSLPEGISELTNLAQLNLNNNQLTSLPEGISKLTNLAQLGLNYNQLTSLPKRISELINLTALNLYHNQLKTLPEEILKLTNLKWLDLNHNQLTSLPEGIKKLKNLEVLRLDNNQLTSLLEGISELTKLEELSLNDNQLTSLPEGISELTNLTELYLKDNPLTSEAIEIVTELEKLGCSVELD